jgi:hypothetical protein
MKDHVDKWKGIVTHSSEVLVKIKPTEPLRLAKRAVRQNRNCSDCSGNSPAKILSLLEVYTKTKEFTRLPYTGLVLELEHLKIETRLISERFTSSRKGIFFSACFFCVRFFSPFVRLAETMAAIRTRPPSCPPMSAPYMRPPSAPPLRR